MSKRFHLLHVLLLSLFFSVTACADSPQSPVGPIASNGSLGGEGTGQGEEVSVLALKYEGRDGRGRSCNLFVVLEEGHHESQEHDHHFLMKADYATSDGHRPHAGEANFYLYDGATGTYYDKDSSQPDTILSLLSLSLKDSQLVPDVNLIDDYISRGELEQYLRVDFVSSANSKAFEEALEKVLDGQSAVTDELAVFDTVQLLNMGTAHGDHYHFPTCTNFRPVGLEETEFEMEGHDHDHGDDHGDGHKH
ncbi:hypothetical protein GW916_07335 [bacterium]|nr:hypothetical protein [bacterium]